MQCRSDNNGNSLQQKTFLFSCSQNAAFLRRPCFLHEKHRKMGISANVLIYRNLCRLKSKTMCVKKHYSAT